MISSLWIAKTGLDAQQTNMDVIANNLANVSTNGFKRQRAVFEDLLYQTIRQPGAQSSEQTTLPSGLQIGTGVRPVATERLHSQGNLSQTNNSKDVAIKGQGFFQVQLPDGTSAYTRDGSFQVDQNGQLVTAGGFQGQRNWTDWLPNADFSEAIMASTFDWNGPKRPTPFATENDTLNGVSMMLGTLVSGTAPCFHDVRTYWSPEACERVTGHKPEGVAAKGFIHLINSGATALDGSGAATNENGEHVMKPFWEMTDKDMSACLEATDWCRANYEYFRGGGFSSHFRCTAEMPVTMLRVNIAEGVGPVLQIAEGWTANLPDEVHDTIDVRTDRTWPTTWFAPRLTGEGAFKDVYSVMANWGANHGVTVYGHVGADLITLASMLRIPVTMHNVPQEKVYRPHAWASFGTQDTQAADYAACKFYGPLYK